MKRYQVSLMGGAVLTATTLNAAEESKPNIIYIMADDLGYGQVGCYGQKMILTPRLDQMAKEGLRLTDYYAGTAVCAPSRCALMTGRHVGHTYIRGNKEIQKNDQHEGGQEPIPASTITVAEKFKEAGYATGLVGKWGLGYPGSEGDPLKQGFDFFAGYNCQRRAHHHFTDWVWLNDKKVKLGATGTKAGHSQYFLTKQARNFIKTNKDRPFFLYLAYAIPHAKLEIPKDEESYLQYKDKEWPEKQKIHAGMISLMDKDIGGILDYLKELKIAKKTVVIFTSDNGPHKEGGAKPDFFEPGPNKLRGIKRSMHEGGIRVPFIAWWPGTIKAGRTSNYVGAHWDFMPTACDLAGVAPPANIDGISYVNLLKKGDKEQKKHKYVYFELHLRGPWRRGLRMGNWVALQQQTTSADPDKNPIELYNLADDLAQKHNLADKYPEKVAEFKKMFKSVHTPSKIFPSEIKSKPKKKKK